MKRAETHNYMAVVGVRMLVQMLAMLYAVAGGGALWALGFEREAKSAFAIGCAVAWAVAPDKESRDAFVDFQTRRQGRDVD